MRTQLAAFSAVAALLTVGASSWTPVQPIPTPDADGRVLGHLPYQTVPEAGLKPMPNGFLVDKACLLQPAAFAALQALLVEAEKDSAVKGTLRGLSCHRTEQYQDGLFCNPETHKRPCIKPLAARAVASAPPGYSEHGTGYTLDFAVRPKPAECPKDVEPCFDKTAAGKWLLQNATRFGFELSFPCKKTGQKDPITGKEICLSAEGVMYEPWHWRWVGTPTDPSALVKDARTRFARARKCYPASPGIKRAADEIAATDALTCPAPQ